MHSTVDDAVSLGGMSAALDSYYDSGQQLYAAEDAELLAQVMYHENYANGTECMLLTGSVVLNRVASADFPNTVHDVLYQKGQYSTVGKFYTTPIPQEVYDNALQLLLFGSIAPPNVIFQAMFTQGSGVYREINGEYFCYK